MANSIHGRYLEAEVMAASPVKLVEMLYRAALEAVGAARRHLRGGNIRERSRSITKAWGIINDLMLSLDHTQGGQIHQSLVELYAYMQGQLLDANGQQTDAPVEEVEKLLTVLAEAGRLIPPAAVAS